jgi:hypothetical protein
MRLIEGIHQPTPKNREVFTLGTHNRLGRGRIGDALCELIGPKATRPCGLTPTQAAAVPSTIEVPST